MKKSLRRNYKNVKNIFKRYQGDIKRALKTTVKKQ